MNEVIKDSKWFHNPDWYDSNKNIDGCKPHQSYYDEDGCTCEFVKFTNIGNGEKNKPLNTNIDTIVKINVGRYAGKIGIITRVNHFSGIVKYSLVSNKGISKTEYTAKLKDLTYINKKE